MSTPPPLDAPPAEGAAPAPPSGPSRVSLIRRLLFLLCGSALTVGFFLPWVTAGTALELTGLGLVFSGGDMVQAISGSGRFLLFLVPVLGCVLVFGAITGHRWTAWVGTFGAGALLLFGVLHVILLFMSSTGLGMWLVVFSSLATLVVGTLSVGSSKGKG